MAIVYPRDNEQSWAIVPSFHTHVIDIEVEEPSSKSRRMITVAEQSTHGMCDTGARVWGATATMCALLQCKNCGVRSTTTKQEGQTSTAIGRGTMLELGAGAGIAGMTAAILGNHVHISDVENVTPRISNNVKSSLTDAEVARVKVVVLDWGDLNAIERAITDVGVVIGADVLFETTWEPLVAAVVHVLTIKPTLDVWLANVGRVAVHRFKRRLQAQFKAARVEEINCQCVACFGHFVWHIYIPQR